MNYSHLLFAVIIGYLIGSVPFGYLLVKFFHKKDIRTLGSGNIGATNVYRFDNNLGIATFALDAIKGLFAAYFVSQIEIIFLSSDGDFLSSRTVSLLAGFSAILGHIYSWFLNFKGGKGVSTMIGYFLYISVPMTVLGLFAWFVCFKNSRYSSLSSLLFTSISFAYGLFFVSGIARLFVFLVCILVVYQHRENIRRLMNGEELRIPESE